MKLSQKQKPRYPARTEGAESRRATEHSNTHTFGIVVRPEVAAKRDLSQGALERLLRGDGR